MARRRGIDLPNEIQGLVPSPEWKRRAIHEKWYAGETISVSIGQGAVSLTPVSMAVYISTLANGGTRVTPHLLKAVDDGKGGSQCRRRRRKSQVVLKPETIQAIRDGLWLVVNGAGTGGAARIAGYDVSGKTGTAQVISNRRWQGREGAAQTRICATTAGSCSSRRATIRRSPAWYSSSTAATAARRLRRSRSTCSKRFSPSRKVVRCLDCRPRPSSRRSTPTDDPAVEPAPASPAFDVPRPALAMFERRLYHHIDWALVIAMLALCALGVVMINSTTADPTRGNSHLYITQLYAIAIGLGAAGVMLMLDYRAFTDKSHLIYIALLAGLLYVMFFGTVQMGARRWIALGGFNLQPSEFAKIGVALVLAKYLRRESRRSGLAGPRDRRGADRCSARR